MMRHILGYIWLVGIALLLTSCASSGALPHLQTVPPMADALWLHIHNDANNQDSFLAVQILPDHRWRWVQTDAFGAPLARKIADQRGWHNDGFLPPNHVASRLFAAIVPIVAQLQNIDSTSVYPQMQMQQSGNSVAYQYHNQIQWRATALLRNKWKIILADGSEWQISVLEP